MGLGTRRSLSGVEEEEAELRAVRAQLQQRQMQVRCSLALDFGCALTVGLVGKRGKGAARERGRQGGMAA